MLSNNDFYDVIQSSCYFTILAGQIFDAHSRFNGIVMMTAILKRNQKMENEISNFQSRANTKSATGNTC
jgi:hypothetical protein